MPTVIDRQRVIGLVEEHEAQLVEVLPAGEYQEEHLPAAVHLPLKSLNADTARVLDRQRPVIVYCWDALCDMSPRAAWRLERLGFGPVYDYAAGKVDWMAAGLPTVRADTSDRRALEVADRNPRTCGPDDLVSEAAETSDGGTVLVVNHRGVLLGRLGVDTLKLARRQPAEDVMEPGPSTVRAHEPLGPLLERMERRHIDEVVVTTPEGELLGAIRPTGEN